MVITTAQVLRRFKSCPRRVIDSRWWGSLTMAPARNKAKLLSSVNRTTKIIYHHHHYIEVRAKILTIWRIHDIIWALWHRHESIIIYFSKSADVSRKIWSDDRKYWELFQYFLMTGQSRFYLDLLPRYSNLIMVQFWQDFG